MGLFVKAKGTHLAAAEAARRGQAQSKASLSSEGDTHPHIYMRTQAHTHRQRQTGTQAHTGTHRHTQAHTGTHRHTHTGAYMRSRSLDVSSHDVRAMPGEFATQTPPIVR